MKKFRFKIWLAIGLCLSFFWSCSASIDSFKSADLHLREQLLPKIQVESQLVSDTEFYGVAMPPLADAVPDPNFYPLYGAQPHPDANTTHIEIYSSSEKANKEREDERWLIDMVEQFNQQRHTLSSGNVIQVGIRNIPSGLGAQILAAKKGKPAGYTPANALWLELLKAEGVSMQTVTSALVPNQAVFAIQP